MIRKFNLLIGILLLSTMVTAQMQATFQTTDNSVCDGNPCDWDGPSILINEIMISPFVEDGSLFEIGNERQGEWIELYNPDVCNPVDISCYYLGNNATDGLYYNAGAGFQIPNGTVIPPAGFCVIRGKNAPSVPPQKLVQNGGNVVQISLTSADVCMGGIRLWFPNAGSWFAFYDANGVPQDAVSWGNQANISQTPCVANGPTCNTGVTSLASYNAIPASRKTNIYSTTVPDSWGRSIRRVPDGGNWVVNQGATQPTQGDCNGTCFNMGTTDCDGTAKVIVTGGTPPYTYLWSDWQHQTTQTAVELCNGTYTVFVKDATGTTATFSVVVENYKPPVSFTFIENICEGNEVLPIVAGTNYSPAPSGQATGVLSGTGVSGNNFNVATAGAGSHQLTYTYTDEDLCQNSASVTINVNPAPNATIGGLDNAYCFEDLTIPLNVSPAGGTLTGPGVVNSNFSITQAGVGNHSLSYEVTDQFGCQGSTSLNVSIFETPTLTIDKVDFTCGDANGEIHIMVNGGNAPYVYSIDGGQTTKNTGSFTNLPQGTYSIIVTDAKGCEVTATETLTSYDYPELYAPDNIDACIGESVVLTAVNVDNVPLFWNHGVQDGVPFTPSNSGIESYIVTGSNTNCTISDTLTVVIHPLPTVWAGEDVVVCKEDEVVLSGYGAATYQWSKEVQNGIPFVPNVSGVYQVTGIDQWGCVNTDEVQVTVNPLPEPDFSADILSGCQPLGVNFFNTSPSMSSIANCKWEFGDGTFEEDCGTVFHKYVSSGIYDVSLYLTDLGGCTGKYTINQYIHVWPKPVASFVADPMVTGTSTPQVNFFNTTVHGDNYVWDFGFGNQQSTTTNAVFNYPDYQEGNYVVSLYAVNNFGCKDSIQDVIQIMEDLIFYVPNTFTPDGNQFNDVFQPIFTQGYDPTDYELRIYNRWGELLFESHNPDEGWDGTYGGKRVQDGTYVWTIEVALKHTFQDERKRFRGHVNVLR